MDAAAAARRSNGAVSAGPAVPPSPPRSFSRGSLQARPITQLSASTMPSASPWLSGCCDALLCRAPRAYRRSEPFDMAYRWRVGLDTYSCIRMTRTLVRLDLTTLQFFSTPPSPYVGPVILYLNGGGFHWRGFARKLAASAHAMPRDLRPGRTIPNQLAKNS